MELVPVTFVVHGQKVHEQHVVGHGIHPKYFHLECREHPPVETRRRAGGCYIWSRTADSPRSSVSYFSRLSIIGSRLNFDPSQTHGFLLFSSPLTWDSHPRTQTRTFGVVPEPAACSFLYVSLRRDSNMNQFKTQNLLYFFFLFWILSPPPPLSVLPPPCLPPSSFTSCSSRLGYRVEQIRVPTTTAAAASVKGGLKKVNAQLTTVSWLDKSEGRLSAAPHGCGLTSDPGQVQARNTHTHKYICIYAQYKYIFVSLNIKI